MDNRFSESAYRLLFEHSLDGVLFAAPDGRILAANPAACRMLRRTEEEICRLGRAGILDMSDPAVVAAVAERARLGRTRAELTFIRGDGARFPADVTSAIFEDANGEPRTATIIRDISAHEQAEESRARLAAIVEGSGDAIIGKDLEGIITSWNPAAQAIYGYSAEEAIGRPVSLLAPPELRHEPGQLAARVQAGEPVVHHETERLRKDGRLIRVSMTLSPIRSPAGRLLGISTIARDVTELKRAEAIAARRSEVLLCIRRINEYLLTASAEQALYQFVCDSILELKGTAGVWIGLKRPDFVIEPAASAGIQIATLQALGMKWEAASLRPAAQAIRTGQAVILDDIASTGDDEHWRTLLIENGIASLVAAPICLESKVLGVLGIWSKKPFAFDRESVEFICEVAGDIALGMRSIKMARKLAATLESMTQTLTGTVETIASLVEYRDPYTAGHERRVAEIARAIGQELGLPEKRIEGLRVIGYLHDVGKIAVPVEILAKPTKLSELEFKLIQSHSEAGYAILKPMQFPWPVADTVLQHHERLDGSGYPKGLKGEEIILEARVIAVADTVEAMATHRPYRPALGLEVALAEIVKGRGTRYDAAVVDACLSLFREKGFAPPS